MLRVFFRRPIFKNPRFVGFVWFATALVACLLKLPVGRTYNNFMIYRASFFHALELKDLYIYYPNEYHDRFLYGIPLQGYNSPFLPLLSLYQECCYGDSRIACCLYGLSVNSDWRIGNSVCHLGMLE